MTDIIPRIYRTGEGGSLRESCIEILSKARRCPEILSMTFFFDASSQEEFDSGESVIREACSSILGEGSGILVTCIAQKPVGTSLAAEVLCLRNGTPLKHGSDHLVIRHGKDGLLLLTSGIRFPHAGDTGEQARAVFGRLGAILEAEGFKVSDIVRQWNYIEGITLESGGVQNYQLFNDARSAFYEGAGWTSGYPAATGIGCSSGGVTVSLWAVKGSSAVSRPIDNPIQVPAHRYSGQVLRSGRQDQRTTPKFERARLLGHDVLISGTAAIKGEKSVSLAETVGQCQTAIEVVESLVDPENIMPGCSRFRFDSLRAYIKKEEDARGISFHLRNHWKGIPLHCLMADICREELLLEVEGTGSTLRFLECCCTDAEEASQAQKGGAGRVELCEDLPCGGVTPSVENITQVLSRVSIPVNVLVRPRGGNFVFSDEEVLRMVSSIKECKALGVNGVVIGALCPDGSVDMEAMQVLMEAAQGMEVTFHRAFDECRDPFEALGDIISLGCDRLLTSGHAPDVNEGAGTLRRLRQEAAGRIVVMAGCGVRPANIEGLEKMTGIREFHSSSHGSDGRVSCGTVAAMTGLPW